MYIPSCIRCVLLCLRVHIACFHLVWMCVCLSVCLSVFRFVCLCAFTCACLFSSALLLSKREHTSLNITYKEHSFFWPFLFEMRNLSDAHLLKKIYIIHAWTTTYMHACIYVPTRVCVCVYVFVCVNVGMLKVVWTQGTWVFLRVMSWLTYFSQHPLDTSSNTPTVSHTFLGCCCVSWADWNTLSNILSTHPLTRLQSHTHC